MGSETFHVIGIKPPDAEWEKMRAACLACESAGVEVPEKVCEFFNEVPPEPKGVVVGLSKYTRTDRPAKSGHHPCITDYQEDSQDGIEIDLTKVPEGIKIIRVSHHY